MRNIFFTILCAALLCFTAAGFASAAEVSVSPAVYLNTSSIPDEFVSGTEISVSVGTALSNETRAYLANFDGVSGTGIPYVVNITHALNVTKLGNYTCRIELPVSPLWVENQTDIRAVAMLNGTYYTAGADVFQKNSEGLTVYSVNLTVIPDEVFLVSVVPFEVTATVMPTVSETTVTLSGTTASPAPTASPIGFAGIAAAFAAGCLLRRKNEG
ncbi:MAG: hypothetical protein Q4Q04_00380 [Methanocorpusculum sp.]|nr:hypothetical protein [Methanocorpusculum sp.]